MSVDYDSLLIVGFGGPEKRDDVLPFLENVLRGRNVPQERMLAVAEHYYHFDGVSPLNQQTRDLIAALRPELDRHGIDLPIYWGNRNWHPMLGETLHEMTRKGHRKTLALVLAGYSSYSSCRQYREDVERARETVGAAAPTVDKVRVFYNHPAFIEASTDRVAAAIQQLPPESESRFHLLLTAHSIPQSMADNCNYALQLREACRLIAEQLQIPADRWHLVYQSRSGRPTDPWLEPDVCDHLRTLASQGVGEVVVMPVGFLSDHMEIMFDLDEEAAGVCRDRGMRMARAATVGTHPAFIAMLRELIQERLDETTPQRAIGEFGPSHNVCPEDCCLAPSRPRPAR